MSRLSPLCGQGVIGVRMPENIQRVMIQLAGKDISCGVLVVQSLSCVWPSVTLWMRHTILHNLLCLLRFIPLSQRCYLTISSSAVLFFCLQSFPSPESFPMSQFFPSGGQSIGALASASALPMNIQDWFPLGLTGLIFLLSRVFSSTTIRKHQFFSAQPSFWFNSHIRTWLLRKP